MVISAPPGPRRPVDPLALTRAADRLARGGKTPWLHEEVARRMAQRLSFIRRTPQTVWAWWPQGGGGREALELAYPKAALWHVPAPASEPRPPSAQGRRPQQSLQPGRQSPIDWRAWLNRWRTPAKPPATARWQEAEAVAGTADLVWANMVLQMAAEPARLLAAWERALASDGFLMFSTWGAGSLPELRELYARAGWGSPMAPLVDMHDWGDLLVQCGFADPVMDQETLTLTWSDPAAALAELRTWGCNADPARHPGLRTTRWRDALLRTLTDQARSRSDGRVALTLEVVYGHAFKALPRADEEGVTSIPVDTLRASARRRRPDAGA